VPELVDTGRPGTTGFSYVDVIACPSATIPFGRPLAVPTQGVEHEELFDADLNLIGHSMDSGRRSELENASPGGPFDYRSTRAR
jgi:hypothetical protein